MCLSVLYQVRAGDGALRGFAMVAAMSDGNVDPSMNTEAFKAFTSSPAEPEQTAPSRMPLIIGGVVAAVIVIALVVWLAF